MESSSRRAPSTDPASFWPSLTNVANFIYWPPFLPRILKTTLPGKISFQAGDGGYGKRINFLKSVLSQGKGVNKDDKVPLRPFTRNVNFLEKMILPIALPENFYRYHFSPTWIIPKKYSMYPHKIQGSPYLLILPFYSFYKRILKIRRFGLKRRVPWQRVNLWLRNGWRKISRKCSIAPTNREN
jgi:hypothetical protein